MSEQTLPPTSNQNSVDARYFRQLLDDYVARLATLQEFVASGVLNPRAQQRLADAKDEARERLFLWGRPSAPETQKPALGRRFRQRMKEVGNDPHDYGDLLAEVDAFVHETTARVSSEDCPVPEQEYIANMLESSAMWLQGKSTTVWAEEFGHTALMQSYAKFLRDLRQKLGSVQETEPPLCNCGEFCNKSIGSPFTGTCRRTANGLPVKASGQLCDCGEFCKASLELSFNPKCRRLAKGLPVNGSAES